MKSFLDSSYKKIANNVNTYSLRENLFLYFSYFFSFFALICVFLQLQYKAYNIYYIVAVGCLLLSCILVWEYRLYKKLDFIFYISFVLWAWISALYGGAIITRVCGCALMRCWYICIFIYTIAYISILRHELQWIKLIALLGVFSLSVVLLIAIIRATLSICGVAGVGGSIRGCFTNGRLCAFGSSNIIGMVAGICVIISLFIILLQRYKNKGICKVINFSFVVLLIIDLFALSLSRSRGAIISTAIGCGVLYFCRSKSLGTNWAKKIIGVFIVTFFVCALTIAIQLLYQKVVSLWSEEPVELNLVTAEDSIAELSNLTDRTLIWKATIGMLNEEPSRWITGITAPQVPYTAIADVYEGRPEKVAVHAHNGYLEMLFAFGIPGAIMLGVLLCYWIILCFKLIFSDVTKAKQMNACIGAVSVGGQENLPLVCSVIIAALFAGIVEIYPFPYQQLYPTTFAFFAACGLVSGYFASKKNSYDNGSFKKNDIHSIVSIFSRHKKVLFGALIALVTVCGIFILVLHVKDKKYENRTVNSVAAEMNSADFWIDLYSQKGSDPDAVIMSADEISRINYRNRRQLKTGNVEICLTEIGEVFNGKVATSFIKDTYFIPENPGDYFLNGVATTTEYWEGLEAKMNLQDIPALITNGFGFAVDNVALRKLPTEDEIYKGQSSDADDEMLQSNLSYMQPVIALHTTNDGEWSYVLTYGYGGWVRTEYLAFASNKSDWLAMQNPEYFLVVIRDNVELDGKVIRIGSKLPIIGKDEEGYYVSLISGIENSETVGRSEILQKEVYVKACDDFSLGYLDYTINNLLKLSMSLINTPYEWGGVSGGLDCSSFVRNVYACFGFELPRTAEAQINIIGASSRTYNDSGSAIKYRRIAKLSPGSFLYFKGHIMLFLGEYGGSLFCISSVESLSNKDLGNGKVEFVRNTEISDMLYVTRKTGKTWLRCIEKSVSVR